MDDDQRRADNNRDSLRVCVVGSGWAFLSGISYYTCRMANALADQHQVSVILMRRLIPRRLYPGADRVGENLSSLRYRDDVPCFDGVDYYWLPSMLPALLFLFRQRPDVLVLEWWSGAVLHSYLLLATVARLLGARVVIEFHEAIDTGEAALPLASAYVRLLSRPLMRMSAGAAVHSEFDRRTLARFYPLEGKPVVVVPHGPYDSGAAQAQVGSHVHQGSICNVLFFGTIRPYKGLEYLVEAFNRLKPEEVGQFRLTVVGETWEGWKLPSRLIESSPHRDRITFVNRYVHDEDVADFFLRASAVVLPYLRASASGPLHMAMSHGLPVVVSNVGGLPEAVADYDGVRLVQPGDVDELYDALLELPGKAGHRYSDSHSWSHSARLLAALFADEASHSRQL